MKGLLLGASALALMSSPAWATLQICVSEVGVAGSLQCSATSSTGSLTFSPTTEPQMGSVSVTSSGVPIEANPDLATTNLNATTLGSFTGPVTLDVEVFQTGLTSVNANLQSTFTVNNLITTPGLPLAGPSVLSDFTGGTGTALGTQLHTDTFGQIVTGTGQFGPTAVNGITSDAQQFLITFNSGGETTTDTIQTIGVVAAVAEPRSWTLLGVALGFFGLMGWVRSRNSGSSYA